MTRIKSNVDTSGINQVQNRLTEVAKFATSGVEVGWPDGAEGVTQDIQDKMFWLDRGTPKQRPRPFLQQTRTQADSEASEQVRDAVMEILNGASTSEASWDRVGKFWEERLRENLLRMTSTHPLEPSTVEWERRMGAPAPEQVGRFTGESMDALTHRVLNGD